MSTNTEKKETTEFAKDVSESTTEFQKELYSKVEGDTFNHDLRKNWPSVGDESLSDDDYLQRVCREITIQIRNVLGPKFIQRHRSTAMHMAYASGVAGDASTLFNKLVNTRENIVDAKYNAALELPRPVSVRSVESDRR